MSEFNTNQSFEKENKPLSGQEQNLQNQQNPYTGQNQGWRQTDNGCTYHMGYPARGAHNENTGWQNPQAHINNGQGYGQPQNPQQPYSQSGRTNPAGGVPKVKKEKPKKQATGKYRAAALIAACMILSLGCGFGGTMLANSIGTKTADEPSSSALFNESSSREDSSSQAQSEEDENASAVTANQKGGQLSADEVVKKCADSVVEIMTESVSTGSMFGQYVKSGAGSGVILTADGYIVTNHHVIEGATSVKVTLRNGTSYDAKLVASDEQSDLAVIKIEAEGLTTATLADSDTLEVGQTAIAIGNPLGQLGGSVSQGILSALDREITVEDNTMTLLQTDAAINPGNSGGGLFNDSGELIGIVNAKSGGENIDGLGFAIPSNLVKSVAEQLITQGYVSGRISIGMSMIEIDDIYTAYYYGVSRTGLYVQSVSGSNAKEAGFETGDCIVAVGDTAVSSVSEFNEAIKDYQIGDTVDITVIRGNRKGVLKLVLAEYTGEAAQGATNVGNDGR